jgi:hypothetical protein
MANDKLNPKEKGIKSKSSSENGSDDASESLLSKLNEQAKKDFKTIEDVVKTIKQQDKFFAEQGKEKKVEPKQAKVSISLDRDERLLKLEHPNSSFVSDELREEAERTKSSILDVWDNSTYFQREAAARAEESKQKANAEGKISSPSGESVKDSGVIDVKGLTLSAADKEFMEKEGISAEDVAATIEKKNN